MMSFFTLMPLILLGVVLMGPQILRAATVVACDETGLAAAVAIGGRFKFDCDGTILLTSPLVITNSVSLDANGHSVLLSGGDLTRIAIVSTNGSLHASGLTFTRGRAEQGGALLVDGGLVELTRCTFSSNSTINPNPLPSAAPDRAGGSVLIRGGVLRATGCQFANNTAAGEPGGVAADGGVARGGDAAGGAIAVRQGWLSLTNCILSGNTARGGDGSPALVGLGGGAGSGSGGAIDAVDSVLWLVDCLVGTNTATTGFPGSGNFLRGPGGVARGGGIALSGRGAASSVRSVVIRNLSVATFRGGWEAGPSGAAMGGGFSCLGGSLEISEGSVTGNSATAAFSSQGSGTNACGGGIYNASTTTVARVLVGSNIVTGSGVQWIGDSPGAGQGAGIWNRGNLRVQDSSILWNLAEGGTGPFIYAPAPALAGIAYSGGRGGSGMGGGIFNAGGAAELANSTVGLNQSLGGLGGTDWQGQIGSRGVAHGAGIYNEGSLSLSFTTIARNSGATSTLDSSGILRMGNSIVAYDAGGRNLLLQASGTGAWVDEGNNISSDGSARFPGNGSLVNLDPVLLPLADNGGPTPTMALDPRSPAIDAANDSRAPVADQRGVTRPGGGHPDIGAYELAWYIRETFVAGPGTLRMTGIGIQGQPFVLLRSPDLVQWDTMAQGFASTSGEWDVEVPLSAGRGFYQIRANP